MSGFQEQIRKYVCLNKITLKVPGSSEPWACEGLKHSPNSTFVSVSRLKPNFEDLATHSQTSQQPQRPHTSKSPRLNEEGKMGPTLIEEH